VRLQPSEAGCAETHLYTRARHRLVNDALREEMPKIHALSIKKAAPPS
jgi:stress-induced morphogen